MTQLIQKEHSLKTEYVKTLNYQETCHAEVETFAIASGSRVRIYVINIQRAALACKIPCDKVYRTISIQFPGKSSIGYVGKLGTPLVHILPCG